MNKQIIISVFGGVLLACTSHTVLADDIPTTLLPMSTILQDLQSKGYDNIRKIKFEHDVYEVEAISKQGTKIKLSVNPQTGKIANSPMMQKNSLSMRSIVQKVEAAGYHSIYKVKSEDNKYEIKALDKNNKKVELNVDAQTGEIKKEGWFD